MRKYLSIILSIAMILSLVACGSEPVAQAKIEIPVECQHTNVTKRTLNDIEFINDMRVMTTYGTHYICLDCEYEWDEYTPEYLKELEKRKSYTEYVNALIEYPTEEHISPCPKCGKTAPSGVKDPRYCPYCKFDRISGTTLSNKQLENLVEKTPIEVKDACKTYGDVVAYMKASKMLNYTFTKTEFKKYGRFDFELNGEQEVEKNIYSNCSGKTNLFNYLLDGDYDDQGIIHMYLNILPEGRKPGNGGTHLIAYVKLGDKYYGLDLNEHENGGTRFEINESILEMDNLEDFVEASKNCQGHANYIKSFKAKEFLLVIIYKPIGPNRTYIPYSSRWNGDEKSIINLQLPMGTEDLITVLYNKTENDKVTYQEIVGDIPGWNCPIE